MRRGSGGQSLERALVELADYVEWPSEKGIASLVQARISGQTAGASRTRRIARPVLVALVAAIGLVVAGAYLFPDARRAVADWLGVSGIEIRVRPDAPTPTVDSSIALNL